MRNKPCPCGSLKKFKKCCWPKQLAANAEAMKPQPVSKKDIDKVASELHQAELREIRSRPHLRLGMAPLLIALSAAMAGGMHIPQPPRR